jgi:predicted CopG family antitoxin
MSDLTKHIRVTADAHEALSRAKIELFGSESVRYSEVIETLAEQALSGDTNDE